MTNREIVKYFSTLCKLQNVPTNVKSDWLEIIKYLQDNELKMSTNILRSALKQHKTIVQNAALITASKNFLTKYMLEPDANKHWDAEALAFHKALSA